MVTGSGMFGGVNFVPQEFGDYIQASLEQRQQDKNKAEQLKIQQLAQQARELQIRQKAAERDERRLKLQEQFNPAQVANYLAQAKMAAGTEERQQKSREATLALENMKHQNRIEELSTKYNMDSMLAKYDAMTQALRQQAATAQDVKKYAFDAMKFKNSIDTEVTNSVDKVMKSAQDVVIRFQQSKDDWLKSLQRAKGPDYNAIRESLTAVLGNVDLADAYLDIVSRKRPGTIDNLRGAVQMQIKANYLPMLDKTQTFIDEYFNAEGSGAKYVQPVNSSTPVVQGNQPDVPVNQTETPLEATNTQDQGKTLAGTKKARVRQYREAVPNITMGMTDEQVLELRRRVEHNPEEKTLIELAKEIMGA